MADAIPDELARIVEFLNEQMPNIEVLAVEIKQFRDDKSAQTLVPRVIGRVAGARGGAGGASGSRRKLNREEFLEELGDDDARDAAARLFDIAHECGARIEGKASSISIRAPMRGEDAAAHRRLALPAREVGTGTERRTGHHAQGGRPLLD